MTKKKPTPVDLQFFEKDHHDRTRRWLGKTNLETIHQSTVLMVGAGAVGNVALVGNRVHTAFITYDPAALSGIKSISNTVSFTITK